MDVTLILSDSNNLYMTRALICICRNTSMREFSTTRTTLELTFSQMFWRSRGDCLQAAIWACLCPLDRDLVYRCPAIILHSCRKTRQLDINLLARNYIITMILCIYSRMAWTKTSSIKCSGLAPTAKLIRLPPMVCRLVSFCGPHPGQEVQGTSVGGCRHRNNTSPQKPPPPGSFLLHPWFFL